MGSPRRVPWQLGHCMGKFLVFSLSRSLRRFPLVRGWGLCFPELFSHLPCPCVWWTLASRCRREGIRLLSVGRSGQPSRRRQAKCLPLPAPPVPVSSAPIGCIFGGLPVTRVPLSPFSLSSPVAPELTISCFRRHRLAVSFPCHISDAYSSGFYSCAPSGFFRVS